jgi:hypothetical protein
MNMNKRSRIPKQNKNNPSVEKKKLAGGYQIDFAEWLIIKALPQRHPFLRFCSYVFMLSFSCVLFCGHIYTYEEGGREKDK